MRATENKVSRCPKCIGGRLLVDPYCGETYCLNCGWRQNRRPPVIGRHADTSPVLSLSEAGRGSISDGANDSVPLATLLKWLEDDES